MLTVTLSPSELVALISSSGALVLIWLVQLVIYPSFRSIDHERFRAWHAWYTSRVSIVVVPLMLGQAGSAVLLLGTGTLPTVYGAAVAGTWATTFLVSVPLHNRLAARGFDPACIERLIATNWVRTFLWTLAFACVVSSCWSAGIGILVRE